MGAKSTLMIVPTSLARTEESASTKSTHITVSVLKDSKVNIV